MFKKTNIHKIRFVNPENDTIEVIYTQGRGKKKQFFSYYMPVHPSNTNEWKIIKSAGWDFEKIQEETVEWKKSLSKSFNSMIENKANDIIKQKEKALWDEVHKENDSAFAKLIADERAKWEEMATEERARLQKWSDDQIEKHRSMNEEEKRKFEEEQTRLYENRIAHITADINNNSGNDVNQIFYNKLYDILTSDIAKDDEMVFKFKLKALEDKSNFKGLNKTEEKVKRREIRKATTIREIIGIL